MNATETRTVCVHCDSPVRQINYALGPKWMHVDPKASFPTERKGTAWWHCRSLVAEPAEDPR